MTMVVGIAEATTAIPILFNLSQLLFLHCMINILNQMKQFLVLLMHHLSYFIIQSIDSYDGLARVVNPSSFIYSLFSGENSIWSPCFLFIRHYRVIQLRYFWWNYFMNKFSLIHGLLRMFCLPIVYSHFIMIIHIIDQAD